MLFATPTPSPSVARDLGELDALRSQLTRAIEHPRPWMGTLRRLVRAKSVAHSTGIEGFHVSEQDAIALVNGEARADAGDTDRQAVECYARAMDHVGVLARDPSFGWQDRVILDLHHDACSFQRTHDPGLWRRGPVGIVDDRGRVVYSAPSADEVPGLMFDVAEWLEGGDLDAHVVVRAAMAHLHVVSVHPFRDGNGRIARIMQSLVLARGGLLAPEFASIEQYLGERTPAYYEILQQTHGRTYDPTRDAGPWVAFCVTAHLDEGHRRLAQVRDAAARWERLEQLAATRDWPDRFVVALEQSLFGGCHRTAYLRETDVSPATASTDLRRMVDAGVLVQQGRGPSTRYEPSDALRAAIAGLAQPLSPSSA